MNKYVDKYIKIIERNELAIEKRLMMLVDTHIDRIDDIEPDMMTQDQKIKTVLEYYKQSIDKDNPMRAEMSIDVNMHGRMLNSLQSYDIMDNKKYKNLEALLEAMKETFGYNQDI